MKRTEYRTNNKREAERLLNNAYNKNNIGYIVERNNHDYLVVILTKEE